MRSHSPRVSSTTCSSSGLAAERRSKLDHSRTAAGGMAQPTFFKETPSSTLAEIAASTQSQLIDASRASQRIRGLASLDEAGPMHLTFFDNQKYAAQLPLTKAGACLVSERFEADLPPHVAVLRSANPFRAFVNLARQMHEDALRPQSWFAEADI